MVNLFIIVVDDIYFKSMYWFLIELFILILVNKLSKVFINMIWFDLIEVLMYYVVLGVWFFVGLIDGMLFFILVGINFIISV